MEDSQGIGPRHRLWKELEQQGTPEWIGLSEQLSQEDLESLLTGLSELIPPERIDELAALEQQQAERGAGFHRMLPCQIAEPLPRPAGTAGILHAAVALAKIRKTNLSGITEAFSGAYPLAFTGRRWPDSLAEPPEGWTLDLDLSGVHSLVSYLGAARTDPDRARKIAAMPAFAEMMRHRRELGYVPEPLIDEEGLAWCIEHAASQDPVDRLWRWLHPHNLFDLADVANHLSSYAALIESLEAADARLTDPILARIAEFAPEGTRFRDKLSFAVGWAIRGWATETTGGINLEHFKDDLPRMLDTLIHETFHRLQTRICRADPDANGDGFESITSLALDDTALGKLYTVLAYLMLEGSATYVGAREPDPDWAEQQDPALELLDRAITAVEAGDTDAIDGILNEGLRSNGPFYGFGAWLSKGIVERRGPKALGDVLSAGAVEFLWTGAQAQGVSLSSELLEACARLRSVLEK